MLKSNLVLVLWLNGTSFENYAIDNNFINDTDDFIAKKSRTAKYAFTFNYDNTTLAFWIDFANNKGYVNRKIINDFPFNFAFTLNEHSENTLLIKNYRKYKSCRLFIDFYKSGNLFFENLAVKAISEKLLKKLILC